MISVDGLTVEFGGTTLFQDISFVINEKDRIALMGKNGAGKSTLLKILAGVRQPTRGSISAPKDSVIAYLPQHLMTENSRSVFEETSQAFAHLFEMEECINRMNEELATRTDYESESYYALIEEVASLSEKFYAIDMTHYEEDVEKILLGLGFSRDDFNRPTSDFSGGWRMRIELAKLLLQQPDVLLLDEPTNHLDIDSLIWLENWLRRVEATVIIISHDREFLDRSVNTIWSVEDGTICRYAGNYSQFELARIEKLRAQESARRAYETQAAHLTSFIERFRAKATKARQAQSRIKMLEKLQAVEPVRAKREWRFNFLKPLRLPEHLVDGENLKIGYGDKVVLSGVSFSIRSGERIGILGVNGAGKSTLVKAIVGELTPMSGELRRGQGLEIGYFAQHQLDQLRMDETPLEHLRHLAPDAREQELRDFLGTYRFSGDFAEAKVAPMSGGEKARLALALIAWKKPNLLVLDEPTNHLDMETREALTMALSTYEGAVLLVSHDRHLLRAVTDELWLVHEGRKEVFEGDLDDYAKIVLDHRRVTAAEARAEHQADKAARNEAQPVNNKEARRLAAQERARIAELRKPLKKELEKVEREMNALSEKLKALDTQLADPAFYNGADQGKVAQTLREHGELAPKVEALEMHWLELSEKIEALGTAASA